MFFLRSYLRKMIRVMPFLLLVLGIANPAYAHPGYHYAGVTNTSLSTKAQATITQNSIPPKPRVSYLHTVGWVVLWDTDASGQYAEAGVGWSTSWHVPKGRVALWYATPQVNTGVIVGNVPLGTPVQIVVTKPTVDPIANITWTWIDPATGNPRTITATPSVPGWIDMDGIHPVKTEVYSASGDHPEAKFTFTNTNVSAATDPNASLAADDPYAFTTGSTLENFGVFNSLLATLISQVQNFF